MAATDEKDLLLAFGLRLEQLRHAMGYAGRGGQAAFAERVGATAPQYNQWEKGKRRPDMLALGRIVTETEVTVGWLYHGDTRGMPYDLMKKIESLP